VKTVAVLDDEESVSTSDDRVAILERDLETTRAELTKERARSEHYRRQLAEALRRIFGRRSEKLDPAQLALSFGNLADAVHAAGEALRDSEEPAPTAPDDEEPPPPARRRARKRRPGVRWIDPRLPRLRRETLPPEEERCCKDCGAAKQRIGEEVSEELDFVPAHLVVIEHVRIKMACRACEANITVAPAPVRPIPRSKAGAGLLSHVLVAKYADHLPLYRQERMLARAGIEIARSTLCDWVGGVAELVRPLVSVIRADVLASGYVRADETPIRVNRGKKKGRTDQCYLWSYLGGGQVVFDFTTTRARDGPNRFLEDFQGYLQCDGYTGYDEVAAREGVVRLGCMAHVRRPFYEAFEADPAGASVALGLIQRLYAVEREARDDNLEPHEVVVLRQERSVPIFEQLDALMPELGRRSLPQSALGKAVSYYRSQRSTLDVYLRDGHLGIDNNPVENAIRAVALGRKNWLFAGSPAGGHRAAAMYTLIRSAQLVGLDPLAYLSDVIGRLATTPMSRVPELTPLRWKAAQLQGV
jgi:transposase